MGYVSFFSVSFFVLNRIQISELREHLDHMPASPSPKDELQEDIPGPELLFGRHRHATKEEIIAALPPRTEVDNLVETFFLSMDTHPSKPATQSKMYLLITAAILHKPTFLKQVSHWHSTVSTQLLTATKYQNFWTQPFNASTMWLGLLYCVLAIGFRFEAAVESRERDGSVVASDPSLMLYSARMSFYREKVVQCMILANYTQCPPYTIETMLLYFGTEYLRTPDTQYSMYVLVGMLVRLAFRMGYHRDSSRFPNISPFTGELRRRQWIIIMSIDLVTSAQVGLPRMIQPFMYDTQEPRNLNEEDLYEDIREVPAPRPETELSQLLYSIFLTRIRRQQAQIIDTVNSTSQPAYREIMSADEILGRIYDSIPHAPGISSLEEFNVTTLPGSMRRVYLDLGILKAKLMLHRPYLKLGRTDAKYDYSRRVCLNAAVEMLRFQRKLDELLQSDGKLSSQRWRIATVNWYMSSIIAQDFLLATSVLILDLDEDLDSPLPRSVQPARGELLLDRDAPTREEIIASLRSAYEIWTKASKKSQEAFKVAAAVKLVLSKSANSEAHVNDSQPSELPGSFSNYDINRRFKAVDSGKGQMNYTSPTPSLDYNEISPAAPDVFSMANGTFGHAFDLTNISMDLDGFSMGYNWVISSQSVMKTPG